MSLLEPTPAQVDALKERWRGQGWRLRAIAEDLVLGRDWTRHLDGLPFIDEVAPHPGERFGRDLRGADLATALRPAPTIREARFDDVPSIARVLRQARIGRGPLGTAVPVGSPPEDEAGLSAALRRGEAFLLVELLGRTAGVVRVGTANRERAGERGEIADLAVRPRFQGLGVGTRLLSAAEATLTSWGVPLAWLKAIPEAGQVHWYERRGYRITRTVQRQPRDGAAHLEVEMEKVLLGGA